MIEITIKDKRNGSNLYAYPVGKYLCAVRVEKFYMIYKLKQKEPFIDVRFLTLQDCLDAIQMMIEIYGEFLPILDNKEWGDADIPALFQWTIKNGVNIYKIIQEIERSGEKIRCSSLKLLLGGINA